MRRVILVKLEVFLTMVAYDVWQPVKGIDNKRIIKIR